VLSRRESALVIDENPPPICRVAELMYGRGLLVGEACAVRVMDIDLDACNRPFGADRATRSA
jgi:hypothetical protein